MLPDPGQSLSFYEEDLSSQRLLCKEEQSDFPPRPIHNHTEKCARRNQYHWIGHSIAACLIIALVVILIKTRATTSPELGSYQKSHMIRPSEAFWEGIDHLAETEPFFYSRRPHFDPHQEKWAGYPNSENEYLWSDLTRAGLANITAREAEQLTPQPAPIAHDLDQFIVNPQVYHDLHCLNIIRGVFWKAAEDILPVKNQTHPMILHVDHCIQVIRQTLMCQADLSPISWYWHEDTKRYYVVWDSERQCRRWENVHSWAKSRQMTGELGPGQST